MSQPGAVMQPESETEKIERWKTKPPDPRTAEPAEWRDYSRWERGVKYDSSEYGKDEPSPPSANNPFSE